MIALTTNLVKGGFRPRITLVWPDGVRIRSRAGGRVGSRHGRAAEAGGGWRGGDPTRPLGAVLCRRRDEPQRWAAAWGCPVPFRHTLFAAACPAEARAAHPSGLTRRC